MVMKRLGGSYAYYYNWKYDRKGYLFQDRFKSENVEDDIYLKTVIRYILNNPIKAGKVNRRCIDGAAAMYITEGHIIFRI